MVAGHYRDVTCLFGKNDFDHNYRLYVSDERAISNFRPLHELIWILVPWFTFTLSNWAVSTILDGEGKFKEIFVGSAFALVPYIILMVPISLLSRWLSLDESGIYSFYDDVHFMLGWLAALSRDQNSP